MQKSDGENNTRAESVHCTTIIPKIQTRKRWPQTGTPGGLHKRSAARAPATRSTSELLCDSAEAPFLPEEVPVVDDGDAEVDVFEEDAEFWPLADGHPTPL